MLAHKTGLPFWRAALAGCCSGLLLIAVFTVPYHVPVRPSLSNSYIFGYSNRAGVILVLLFALAAATFLPSARPVPRFTGKPLTRSTLYKTLAIILFLGTVMFLLTYRLDGFIESVYTVDRTRLLLEGHTPYRDFEFGYGLLILYAPAFLVRHFGLTVSAACMLFFLAASIFGVCQLYLILTWSEFPSNRCREVFLVIVLIACLPTIIPTTPVYTLARFLTGGFFAMISQRLLVRGQTSRTHLLALLLPVPAAAITILISPEMGLAYIAGISLYLLRFGNVSRPLGIAAYLAMLTGVASIVFIADRSGAFTTLSSFGAGGFNNPIVPAPHILLFLFAVAVSAAYLAEKLRAGRNSPLVALGSIAPGMLPAALGRCDPGHVIFDGVLILIIALLVCSTASRFHRLLLPAVICIFFLVPFVTGLRSIVSTLTLAALPNLLHTPPSSPQHAIAVRLALRIWGPVKGEKNLARMRSRKDADQAINVAAVFQQPAHTIFAAPFAFYGDHTGPYHTPAIDEGYFLSVGNMVTPDAVARKIAELSSHPERPLLIPFGAEFSCLVSSDGARAEIQQLFTYPYRAPAVHPGDVAEPLCAYIRTHYGIVQPATADHFGTALWTRNPPATPPADLIHRAAPPHT